MIPGLKQFVIGLHLTLGTMMESPLPTDRLRRIKMESLKSKALCSPSPIKILQIGIPPISSGSSGSHLIMPYFSLPAGDSFPSVAADLVFSVIFSVYT